MPRLVPLILFCLLLLGSLLLHHSPLQAQGKVQVSLQNTGQLSPIRSTDGQTLGQQNATQFLGLRATWAPPGQHRPKLQARLRLRLDSDPGLDPGLAERLQDGAASFAVFQIQEAQVSAHRLRGVLDLNLGRHLIVDPVTSQHIDGIQATLHFPHKLFLRSYVGALVTPASPWSYDTSLGALWPDRAAATHWDTLRVQALGIGVNLPRLKFQIAARRTSSGHLRAALNPPEELAPDTFGQEIVTDERIGASLWTNPLPSLTLQSDLRYSLARQQLDRALLDLAWAWDWHALRTGLRLDTWTPDFDLNSIFSVFGAQATASAQLHASATPKLHLGQLDLGQLQLGTNLGLSNYGDPGSQALVTPWGQGSDQHNLSTTVRVGWASNLRPEAWFTHAQTHLELRAEDGWAGRLLAARLLASSQIYRGRFDLTLQGTVFHTESDLQLFQRGTSAAFGSLANFNLKRWGYVDVGAEIRSTAAFYYALRMFARYRLDYEIFQ